MAASSYLNGCKGLSRASIPGKLLHSLLYFSILFKKGGRGLSAINAFLTILIAVFTAGSFYYLRLLGFSASYPPKRVLKQKALFCAGGACVLLLLLFCIRLLI